MQEPASAVTERRPLGAGQTASFTESVHFSRPNSDWSSSPALLQSKGYSGASGSGGVASGPAYPPFHAGVPAGSGRTLVRTHSSSRSASCRALLTAKSR